MNGSTEEPQLRIIQSEIGEVIPIVDIAKQIKYSDSGLRKIIKRYPKEFQAEKVFTPIPTIRGLQKAWCLTRKGMEALLLLLSPGSGEKASLMEKRVQKFHLQDSTQPFPAPDEDPVALSLRRNADRADILIERWGYDPIIARKLTMELVVQETGDIGRALKGPALLPAPAASESPAVAPLCTECAMSERDPDFEKYFSLDKVSSMCGITRAQAQSILEKQDLLAVRMGVAHLTRLAETLDVGRVFTHYPLFPHRMTPRKMIRYSPVAVERIKAVLAARQTQLDEGGSVSSGINLPPHTAIVPQTTSIAGHCG